MSTESSILVLNFAHPLTPAQLTALTDQLGAFDVREYPGRHWDLQRPFAEQAEEVLDEVGLDPAAWQAAGLVVGLPSLHVAAATLLAAIHGRCGHFPSILRLAPVEGGPVTVYQLAEVINLEAVRAEQRLKR